MTCKSRVNNIRHGTKGGPRIEEGLGRGNYKLGRNKQKERLREGDRERQRETERYTDRNKPIQMSIKN